MATIKDIGTKIENSGTTKEGRLSADEFNVVVSQVIDNMDDITSLEVSKIGYISVSVSSLVATVSCYDRKNGTLITSFKTAAQAAVATALAQFDANDIRMTKAESRITALEDADPSAAKDKVGYGKTTEASHKTTLSFYAASDSTTPLFEMQVASADVYSVLSSRLDNIESRIGVTITVIEDYNLDTLMAKSYDDASVLAIAKQLYKAVLGGVVLMKTSADGASDTSYGGYTYIVADGRTYDNLKRTYTMSFHFYGQKKMGTFSMNYNVTSATLLSAETEALGDITSEVMVEDNGELLTEIALALQSSDDTTTENA